MKFCNHCMTEQPNASFNKQPERCDTCCSKNIFDNKTVDLMDSEVKFCYICKKPYPLHSFIYDEGECSDSCFGCATVHQKRLKIKNNVAEWRATHPDAQKLIERRQDLKRRENADRAKAIKYNKIQRRNKKLEFERKLAKEIELLSENIEQSINTFDEGFKDSTSFNEMLAQQLGKGGIYG